MVWVLLAPFSSLFHLPLSPSALLAQQRPSVPLMAEKRSVFIIVPVFVLSVLPVSRVCFLTSGKGKSRTLPILSLRLLASLEALWAYHQPTPTGRAPGCRLPGGWCCVRRGGQPYGGAWSVYEAGATLVLLRGKGTH